MGNVVSEEKDPVFCLPVTSSLTLHDQANLMYLLLGCDEVCEHGVGIGDLEGIGSIVLDHFAGLNEEFLDLHVIEHRAVSPRPLAKAALRVPSARHSHAAGEGGGAIGKELNLSSGGLVQFNG
jgi:hypothetical protein